MTSDRELLELAAKAAGINLYIEFGYEGEPGNYRNGINGDQWHPLKDDGAEPQAERPR